ncbi:MAG: hypothetical protein KA210_00905 [Bacteroidia bacterium]|nr:hypothetical protein [Bacteroidia bacterium]
MDKDFILNNVDDFSAEQHFDFINQGVVTLDDLKNTGDLVASKRSAIIALQSIGEKEDDTAWEIARYGNESKLSDYITNYPAGKHVLEAKQKIDNLERERENSRLAKQGIIDNIKINPNKYSPKQIRDFLQNGTLTESDLINCKIPKSAIENLNNIQKQELVIGDTPTSIPDGYTEVYFWGATGSGKTCALGAILQKAQQKGYLNIAPGSGFLYANQLKNIFSDDGLANDYLPPPSPLETTQYLPFTLKDPNENFSRSVSLIELSGEIFKCFLNKNAGIELPTEDHVKTFNSLNVFLNSNNRKIHFFFIDYDRENKPDGNGLTQSDYLASAATFFNNNNVFGKYTDAIYVVLTKSDLLIDENGNRVNYEKRVEYAIKHLKSENYNSFIETLKTNCKKNSINGGKLTVEPFSLGDVYFQDICNFDGSSAEKIVNILMERIPVTKKSFFDILNK